MDIRNRIIGLRYIKASELSPHPQNWRKHPKRQADALRGVLSEIGWVDAALFNVTTGRLIDGHLRRDIAGDAEIPVLDVELTEDEERAVLLTFDPISAMAETETRLLQQLMDDMRQSELAFNNDDLLQSFDHVAALTMPDWRPNVDEYWQGMPEFEQHEIKPFHSIAVHFKTEADMLAFADLLQQVVTKQARSIYYPEQKRQNRQGVAFVDEQS